jgi:hypothetical protein
MNRRTPSRNGWFPVTIAASSRSSPDASKYKYAIRFNATDGPSGRAAHWAASWRTVSSICRARGYRIEGLTDGGELLLDKE